MDIQHIFQQLATALGIGLLIGLQRERAESPIAGIRTFALLALLGTVCGLLGTKHGEWVVAAGAIAVTALLVVGNVIQARSGKGDPGITTEIAAVVTYAIGAYLVQGEMAVAVAVGGGVALLLHFKAPMHRFVRKIGEEDLTAIMRFVLVAFVILPVLPNESYGPYQVLNPREIWLMVVLIVGIGLGGYIAYKLFGERSGTILAGILGGMISSTATTISFARRARGESREHVVAASVIMIATTVAFVRVLIEIAIVAPNALHQMAMPFLILGLWAMIVSSSFYFLVRGKMVELPPQSNPAELRFAFLFGGLYAGVLLAIAAARDHFGSSGLYGVAILSGLHDLDAITLSTSRLVDREEISVVLGWQLILTAVLANLVIKGIIAGLLGGRRLLLLITPLFGLVLMGGIAILLLWPH